MELHSTRNLNIIATPKVALTKGLADDGGLFSPKIEDIEKNKFDIKDLLDNDFKTTAKHILKIFLSDFTDDELDACINSAYSDKNFQDKSITPISKIGDNFLLELYGGPTSAFKDVALTILPYFLQTAYKSDNSKNKIYILTATSGDTGMAALSGFKDIDNVKITVFYPTFGVSAIQKLQMQTAEGNNVEAYGINGNFDDCQNLVKKIYTDNEIHNLCKDNNVILTSANSINIGRLVPQIIYYIQSYVDLVNKKEINLYDKVNFVVPTGNFGDILAGLIAKFLGLPINKLICASNENDVLTKFINEGTYDKNRTLYKTIAPSIDILVSSNVERLLFFLSSNNDKVVNELMNELNTKGCYTLSPDLKKKIDDHIIAYSANENEYKKKIHDAFTIDKRLIDTHTAVAYACLDKYKKENPSDKSKSIILSTASPYKFARAVLSSIDDKYITNDMDDFACINKLHEISSEPIPKNIERLRSKPIRFDKTFDINEAKEHIVNKIRN